MLGLILSSCKSSIPEGPEICTEVNLLYLSKASGNFDIYKNDLKGQETQLTTNPSWDWAPRWVTASQSLIYNAYENDTFKIQMMELDGKFISTLNEFDDYNVSSDGQWVIAQVKVGDFSRLVITDSFGSDSVAITGADSYNGRAVWSPDASQLIYISDRDGNNEVYHYDRNSALTTRLTENETVEKYLTWAPDNKRIAYTTEYYEEGKPDRNDVFVLDLSTKEVIQITDNPYEDSEIAWSPLGDKIAFHSKRDSIDHIFLMNSDGTGVEQVTTAQTYHGEPAWAYWEVDCEKK
ncbi:MAG: hypothetical protein R8G66_00445 [Cytophagales bacterium]|nr:hypothetical protein [Cytophagales bacterium]